MRDDGAYEPEPNATQAMVAPVTPVLVVYRSLPKPPPPLPSSMRLPAGSCGSSGSSDHPAGEGGTAAAKRLRSGDPAQTANQKMTALNVLVSSQGRRIAGSRRTPPFATRLSADVAWLRKRKRLPESPAALQQLVSVLGAHELNLRTLLFDLVCMPRHLAKCVADLPPDPAGGLGMFAVTVPRGTIRIAKDAFRDCAGLAQVTLPATVVEINGCGYPGAYEGQWRNLFGLFVLARGHAAAQPHRD